jgi:hypothetical protein
MTRRLPEAQVCRTVIHGAEDRLGLPSDEVDLVAESRHDISRRGGSRREVMAVMWRAATGTPSPADRQPYASHSRHVLPGPLR